MAGFLRLFRVLGRYLSGVLHQPNHVEVYIVSAPKAGRTWLSVLLVKLFSDCFLLPADFSLLDPSKQHPFPSIELTHDLLEPTERRPFRFDSDRYGGKKVIFLARDPRDVIVSLYHQLTKRQHLFSGTLSEFIRDERFGIRQIVDFMNLWEIHRVETKAFLLVRYEDMLADTAKELRRIANFVGVTDCESHISAAVQFSSFENMRKLEEKDYFHDNRLRAKNASDTSTFKVRQGKSGSFREELSAEDVAYANAELARLDPYYHYQV